MEVVDEVFISIGGFFPDVFLGEEVGVGWGGGCVSLYNFVCLIVVWGSVGVIWDVDCSSSPVDLGVDFFQPRGAQDDIFISTVTTRTDFIRTLPFSSHTYPTLFHISHTCDSSFPHLPHPVSYFSHL